ncbi:hypothetical protein X737_37040 [Mesorhizobium sp. L48C026A00]|nr:hypothetical protein X737_37040 [Mesorhizobium sp. L48C026A00]
MVHIAARDVEGKKRHQKAAHRNYPIRCRLLRGLRKESIATQPDGLPCTMAAARSTNDWIVWLVALLALADG